MSVPLQLVTGFLGSGKTSFLKHFLKNNTGKGKIALIQNEFSPVDVDGRELAQTGHYELLEINNGSVFCVCLLGAFIDSLAAFIDQVKPDLLLMEASGMSDPIGVGQIFQSPKLKGKVYLDHVWCLVDAHNFEKVQALKFRLEHQLRVADTIILNKIDLAGDKIEAISANIKSINPFAKVLQAGFGQIQFQDIKKANLFFPAPATEPAGRPDLDSIVIKSNKRIEPAQLDRFIAEMKKESIRFKGFVQVTRGKTLFVQGVFDDLVIVEVLPVTGPTELVFIGNFEQAPNGQALFESYCT